MLSFTIGIIPCTKTSVLPGIQMLVLTEIETGLLVADCTSKQFGAGSILVVSFPAAWKSAEGGPNHGIGHTGADPWVLSMQYVSLPQKDNCNPLENIPP